MIYDKSFERFAQLGQPSPSGFTYTVDARGVPEAGNLSFVVHITAPIQLTLESMSGWGVGDVSATPPDQYSPAEVIQLMPPEQAEFVYDGGQGNAGEPVWDDVAWSFIARRVIEVNGPDMFVAWSSLEPYQGALLDVDGDRLVPEGSRTAQADFDPVDNILNLQGPEEGEMLASLADAGINMGWLAGDYYVPTAQTADEAAHIMAEFYERHEPDVEPEWREGLEYFNDGQPCSPTEAIQILKGLLGQDQ
jgi:hypothetical protein